MFNVIRAAVNMVVMVAMMKVVVRGHGWTSCTLHGTGTVISVAARRCATGVAVR